MENIPNSHPMFYYTDIIVEWKGKQVSRKAAFAGVRDNNTLNIGRSLCSEKDIFDKKIARKIAIGRAIKKPIIKVDLSENSTIKISDLFVEKCKELSK